MIININYDNNNKDNNSDNNDKDNNRDNKNKDNNNDNKNIIIVNLIIETIFINIKTKMTIIIIIYNNNNNDNNRNTNNSNNNKDNNNDNNISFKIQINKRVQHVIFSSNLREHALPWSRCFNLREL